MPTIGESFGQGYDVGRAVGEDFSSWKYARGEKKLRQKYADEAKAAGMSVDEYLSQTPDGSKQARIAQLENELHDLYQTSGAKRRGVTDRYGRALDDVSVGNYDTELATGTNRRASTQALAGNIGDAQRTQAAGAAARGDYEHAVQYNRSADTIGITNGAINPDGTVNELGLATATDKLGGQALKYGDTAGATDSIAKVRAIRHDVAAYQGGIAYLMVANAERYKPEDIAQQLNNVAQAVPELMHGLFVTVDKNNKGFALVRKHQDGSEEYVAPFDLKKDALPLLHSLSTDATTVIDSKIKEISDARDAQQKRDNEHSDKIFEAKIEIAKSLKDIPNAGNFVNSITGLQQAASAEGYTVSGDPNNGTVMLTPKDGGAPYIVRIGQPQVDPKTGVTSPAVQIIDADGNTVSADQLARSSMLSTAREAAVQLHGVMAQNLTNDQLARIKGAFTLLDSIGAQAGVPGFEGAGASAGAGGGTRSFPIPETDNYVRSIMGKVGTVSGSNREKAKQLMSALVQQESGGNNAAISPKGARGLTQVMPKTAGDPGFGVKPLQNNSPQEYMRFGEDYLTAMLDRYNGDPELALAAYNAGPGTVDGWVGAGGAQAPQQGTAVAQQAPAAAQPQQAISTKPAQAPSQFAGQSTTSTKKPLLEMRDRLIAASDRVQQLKQSLAQFDRENPNAQSGFIQNAAGRLRARLANELNAAIDERDQLTATVNRGANALRDQTRQALEDRQYTELARRYGTSDHGTAQLASSLEKWGSGTGGSN